MGVHEPPREGVMSCTRSIRWPCEGTIMAKTQTCTMGTGAGLIVSKSKTTDDDGKRSDRDPTMPSDHHHRPPLSHRGACTPAHVHTHVSCVLCLVCVFYVYAMCYGVSVVLLSHTVLRLPPPHHRVMARTHSASHLAPGRPLRQGRCPCHLSQRPTKTCPHIPTRAAPLSLVASAGTRVPAPSFGDVPR